MTANDVITLMRLAGWSGTKNMNSTKVQNPRHKMQVALLAEPKTPLESSVFIGERERAYLVVQTARFFCTLFYPALMYAVMFYVILNKRKLH